MHDLGQAPVQHQVVMAQDIRMVDPHLIGGMCLVHVRVLLKGFKDISVVITNELVYCQCVNLLDCIYWIVCTYSRSYLLN